jgi:NADH:ubiquinone oxidoreductase subunit 3 (subunit A)
MKFLLTPPFGFVIYSALGYLIYFLGKRNAPMEDKEDDLKRSLYGSGEEAPEVAGVPGYKPFLLISLFFALMHLGVLIIGMTTPNFTSVIYTIILMLGLLALILG